MIIWSRMFLVAVLSKKTHDIGIKKGHQLKNTAINYLGAGWNR